MTWSKKSKETRWRSRKQKQNPYGKIKSLKELAEEAGKDK